YRAHEFDYAMKKSGCRALILSAGHKNNDYCATLRACAPEIDAADPGKLRFEGLPKLEIVIRLGADKTPGCSISTTSPLLRPRATAPRSRPSTRRCSSTIPSTSNSRREPPAPRRARR